MKCVLATLTLLSLFAIAWAPTANAQMFPEDTAKPLVHSNELTEFTKTLDNNVATIILSLYDDYLDDVSSSWREYQSQYLDCQRQLQNYLKDHPNQSSYEASNLRDFGFHRLLQDRRRYSERRLNEFTAEIRMLFQTDSKELAAWNTFVKQTWRARLFRMIDPSTMTMGVTNLLLILDQLQLSEEEEDLLSQTVESYSNSLDTILQKYEHEYIDVADQHYLIRKKLAMGDEEAIVEHQEIIDWHRTFAKSIYSLNLQYNSRFASALSPMNKQIWQLNVQAAFHETIHSTSPVDRIVEILRNAESISQQNKVSVELVYNDYLSKRDRLRKHFGESLRSWLDSDAGHIAQDNWRALLKKAENGDRSVGDPKIAFIDNPVSQILRDIIDLERRSMMRLRVSLGEKAVESLSVEARWLLSWDKQLTKD